MTRTRGRQLAYSDLQDRMLDEDQRRTKATKIARVLEHFLGRDDMRGLVVADVGCSLGFVADTLRARGAQVIGVDIDVPGLAKARQRFGGDIGFVCADGERLPWRDESIDVIVFNHIYEHVIDAYAVMDELRRVLCPSGVMYLGLGNRLGAIEPHYKLPFLSWLPGPFADRYVRLSGRADFYHERFLARRGLRRLCAGLHVYDYTLSIIAEPDRFAARDMVPAALDRVPIGVFAAFTGLIPTYIWIATKQPVGPRGEPLRVAPRRVVT